MNKELLEEFVKYCKANPDMRFWQALRNWSEFNYIYASDDSILLKDTFYWKGRNG